MIEWAGVEVAFLEDARVGALTNLTIFDSKDNAVWQQMLIVHMGITGRALTNVDRLYRCRYGGWSVTLNTQGGARNE